MFVVVFSDFGGVWLVLWWTDGGHHCYFVVVRGQKTEARVHPQTGQGTLVVVPTDTGVHVRQNGIGQGCDDGVLAGNPQHGPSVPLKFLDGTRLVLKVNVKGYQCGSSQLWRHCTQQENMSVHSEIRWYSQSFILQLLIPGGTVAFRNKFRTAFEWARHTTTTHGPAKSRPS